MAFLPQDNQKSFFRVAAHFLASTAPRPLAPSLNPANIGTTVQEGFAALKQALTRRAVAPTAPLPATRVTYIDLYMNQNAYKGMSADRTAALLKEGRHSAIPPQEYLLRYLREVRLHNDAKAITTPKGQRVLRIAVPHWKDSAAVSKRLEYWHSLAVRRVSVSEASKPASAQAQRRPLPRLTPDKF